MFNFNQKRAKLLIMLHFRCLLLAKIASIYAFSVCKIFSLENWVVKIFWQIPSLVSWSWSWSQCYSWSWSQWSSSSWTWSRWSSFSWSLFWSKRSPGGWRPAHGDKNRWSKAGPAREHRSGEDSLPLLVSPHQLFCLLLRIILFKTRLKQFLLPFPVQWGLPTVSAEGVLGMMAGVMVSTCHHAKISNFHWHISNYSLKRSPILKSSPCIWALTFSCTVCCNHHTCNSHATSFKWTVIVSLLHRHQP